MSILLANQPILASCVLPTKLCTSNRLWGLAYFLLRLKSGLLDPSRSCICWGHLGGTCCRRAQYLIISLWLLRFLVLCSRSASRRGTALFLSRIKQVLSSIGSWLRIVTPLSACHHWLQSCTVRLCEVLVVWHRLWVRLILWEVRSIVRSTLRVPRLWALFTAFERRGQRCAIILTVSAVAMETWRFATTVQHEETSTRFGRQCASQVLLTTGWTRWGVATRTSLRRMGCGVRRHDEERRWRLLYLLIWVVYTADQRVNQFISRAVGQPFDKELINWALCDLKSCVSCKLTWT